MHDEGNVISYPLLFVMRLTKLTGFFYWGYPGEEKLHLGVGPYSTTKHRNANAIFLVKLIWRLVGQDSDFQVSSTNTKTTMLGSQKIPQYLPQLVIW